METNNKTVVIERPYNAPIERVWEAWTNPEVAKKWWGPKNFTAPVIEMDFQVGGKYLNCMHGVAVPGEEAKDFWSTGVYKEIVPMERIVCTDSFADPNGNVVPGSYYGMPEGQYPLELLVTITFNESKEGTHMRLEHEGLPEFIFVDCKTGWEQSFDKLAEVFR